VGCDPWRLDLRRGSLEDVVFVTKAAVLFAVLAILSLFIHFTTLAFVAFALACAGVAILEESK
jgi:hypothetical protein